MLINSFLGNLLLPQASPSPPWFDSITFKTQIVGGNYSQKTGFQIPAPECENFCPFFFSFLKKLNTNVNPFYPSKLRELKRQRYMSESAAQGDSQEMFGSKVFICSEVSKSGSSLCVSMDFGLGELSKSTLTHLF